MEEDERAKTHAQDAMLYHIAWRNCYIEEVMKYLPPEIIVKIAEATEARLPDAMKQIGESLAN